MKSKKKKSALEEAIIALPPNPTKVRKWTLEEDALMLKYSESRGLSAIARILGVSEPTARKRLLALRRRVGNR